ncbi:MAG: AAA family ATPase [Nitrosopumilus sp.]|jgi:adenylate kinase|nr:AAA family ATPase [Nitrosopumilus sp.]MDH3502351.1 AAA family ATPase [Nitrosopumilus sp.]
MIIVITGNPGVGKHTITKEVLNHLELSLLDINSIAKDSGLFESNGNTNDVNVGELENIINEKISDFSLIVGHLAPYVISSEKIDKVIVLRKNPYDLFEIYEKRGYTKEKSKENAGSEALGIIAYDTIAKFGDKVFQINTTAKSVKEISDIVLKIIKNNYSSETIDWLEMIVKNNDLKKFFAY